MEIVRWNLDKAPDHETISMAFLEGVARAIIPVLEETGLKRDELINLTDSIVFSLGVVFDQGTISISGKRFRPRLRFETELGDAVPVEGSFDLHDYAIGMAEAAFEDD